jgi:hypothetical protein
MKIILELGPPPTPDGELTVAHAKFEPCCPDMDAILDATGKATGVRVVHGGIGGRPTLALDCIGLVVPLDYCVSCGKAVVQETRVPVAGGAPAATRYLVAGAYAAGPPGDTIDGRKPPARVPRWLVRVGQAAMLGLAAVDWPAVARSVIGRLGRKSGGKSGG